METGDVVAQDALVQSGAGDEEVIEEAEEQRRPFVLLDGLIDEILADPILADVPQPHPSLEDVQLLIALEKGEARRVAVEKLDGSRLSLIVRHDATIATLRREFERATVRAASKAVPLPGRKIDWKYVWQRWSLSFRGQRLLEMDAACAGLGIGLSDEPVFLSRIPVDKKFRQRRR